MSGKRRRDQDTPNYRNGGDDYAEAGAVLAQGAQDDRSQGLEIGNIATKGTRRSISPPPLRRRKVGIDEPGRGKGQNEAQEPPKPAPNHSLPHLYQKDRGRAIYLNWSEETELSIMTDQPHLLGTPNARPNPSDELKADVNEVLSEAVRSMKKDTGGFITVDYVDSTKQPQRNEFNTNHLCTRCKSVIAESSVMNRPWRRIVQVRNIGLARIQEEEPVEYCGQKCNVFGHHGQLGALRKSARLGCHLCSLLDAYDPDFPSVHDEMSRKSYVLKVIYAKNHDEGPGVLVLETKGLPTKATYLMFDETKYKIAETLEYGRTDSGPVLALSRKWLRTCLETHEACGARSKGASFLPTRLVKVIGNGDSVQSISLTLKKDISPGTKYLTLSHCWGGADIVKLTETSLEEFKTDIPLSRLPVNFLDAVRITNTLGYEYIWIDSLCIVQDSAEDWKHEAATMGSVYLYSVCTIAAISSRDSYGGCFMNRCAQSFIPCQLIPKTDSQPGVYAENWQHQSEPLHTRAWVVQERALSVRTLNFGAHMISWDCISAKASEREPEMESTSLDVSLKRTFNDLLESDPLQPIWTNSWWKLVTEYSSCNLTFVKDKWAAIEGLALEIEKTSSRNLAHGLWEFNITDELLWTVSRPKKEKLNIGHPSWSWLSIDGVVHRRRYNYALDFRLDARAFIWQDYDLDVKSTEKNEIAIRTRMLPLRWTLRAIDKDKTPSYRFYLVDDRPGSSRGRPNDWFGRWIPDTVADESWETWSLQIVAADTLQLKGSAGLVVVPMEGRKNTWKRIGFYEINWRDESHCDDSVPKRWFGYEKDVILV